MEITQKLNELESFIPNYEVLNSKVSEVTVGWHLEHALRVVNGVSDLLNTAEPTDYRPKFNLLWQYVKLRKGFPRGKAKAPKATRPTEETTEEGLIKLLNKVQNKIATLPETAPQGTFFNHPYFGHLTYKESVYFMAIHTHHHLKIIRDILKK